MSRVTVICSRVTVISVTFEAVSAAFFLAAVLRGLGVVVADLVFSAISIVLLQDCVCWLGILNESEDEQCCNGFVFLRCCNSTHGKERVLRFALNSTKPSVRNAETGPAGET